MKKVINMLKKRNLDVIIFVMMLVANASLIVFVNSYDELWNFANVHKMFNGYKIYDELNVIITPLFFYIGKLFLTIFGDNLLGFRIYNIAIYSIFFMLIYYIFRKLKIVRRRAIFYTFLIFLIFSSMIPSGANYNILVLIPILIALILIIKQRENEIILGILLAITFTLKQNMYIFFALSIFIYKLICQQNIKENIIDLIKIYLVSIIGIFIFLMYMYLDNNLYDFINYCFLGIGEFGSNNFYIEMSGARYLYVAIAAIILTLIMIYNKKINKNIENETIKNTKYLLAFGVPLLLTSLPIVNYFHATLGSIIIIIEFIYILENVLIKNLQINIKKEKMVYKIIIMIYVIYALYGIVINIIEIRQEKIVFNEMGVLYGTIITKEDYENIQIICDYIKKQEKEDIGVKILSYKANLYMTQLNINNGIFDLAFLGNLGVGGENMLIEKINQLTDTVILLETNEEDVFWQESKKARNYIIDNYDKIGEIQEYSIYLVKEETK